MGLRSALPDPITRVVRNGYVSLSALTASSRLEPDFILVGGQRCGTTSLFRAFEQHHQIVRPTFNKGINYFDVNYSRGHRWYRAHFPLRLSAKRQVGAGNSFVSFEASGYYIFHPLAAERIAKDLPAVKIVAMLRDPVERAFSAWKHECARGFDNVSFEEAVETEEKRTRGERDRMIADAQYESYAYRHYSYVARGHYSAQLGEYYRRFPHSSIHVMYSESFFTDPNAEFAKLTDFLGVEHPDRIVFDRHNARPSGPMPGQTREILSEVYALEADALEEMVGHRPPWGQA